MKYCRYCGKEVESNQKFCKHCGKAIIKDDEAIIQNEGAKDSSTLPQVNVGERPEKNNLKATKNNNVKAVIITLVCIIALAGVYIFGAYINSPRYVVKKYFNALIDRDYKKALNYLDLAEGERRSFENECDNYVNSLRNFEILDKTSILEPEEFLHSIKSSSDTSEVRVKCIYSDGKEEKDYNLNLIKSRKKHYLIFDDWRISTDLDKVGQILDSDDSKLSNSNADNNSNVVSNSNVNNNSSNISNNSEKVKKINSEIQQSVSNFINNQNGVYSVAFQDTSGESGVSINSSKMKAASVIKVFVMIEAFNEIKNGDLREDETITLTNSMKVGGTGSICGKPEGTSFSIYELINLMMTDSDNTAANMLIDRLGMVNINKTIDSLGCTDTTLQRKMMDDEKINKGIENYTSIKDLSKVLNSICNNKCLGEPFDKKMVEIMKKQKNNSKLPAKLNNENIEFAHKTGELPGVENDAGIVITPKGNYVICVLTDKVNNESVKEKISDISRIIYDIYISNQ